MSRQIQTNNRISMSEEQTTAKSGGKLLFTDYRGRRAALLIRDDKLLAASFFSEEKSRIGAIYIGKVKNAVKNLGAYFVEIGGEEREICFLSAKDAAHPFLLNRNFDGRILEGDEFPVQVTKDASKNKQASVTTLISLSNPYFAFSVGKPGVGFSNKLSAEQKAAIRTLLDESGWKMPKMALPGGLSDAVLLPIGLVVRTRAAELLAADSTEDTDETAPSVKTTTAHLQRETTASPFLTALNNQQQQWESLFHNALHRTCFSCLSEPPAPWETVFEQFVYPDEYEEILTDDAALYEQLVNSRQPNCIAPDCAVSDCAVSAGTVSNSAAPDCFTIPADKKIRLYSEAESSQLPLSKLYGLESKLAEALDRKVWLKCGGYLVIDPTEALTVIDVNSGKFDGKKDAEETYLRINQEAAEEIARQLRLRNLSSMIAVDFINMKSAAHQTQVLEYLRTLVKKDRQKTVVVDMTPLGLVEITRKKSSKPLAEQLHENTKD